MLITKIVSGIFVALLSIGMLMSAFGFQTAKTEQVTTIAPDDYQTMQEPAKATIHSTTTQSVDWWPTYRHDPQHTSYSTSKAPNDSQIIWTRQFASWVRTSAAVHNHLVFIAGDDRKIHALNAATGKEVWNYTTEGYMVSSPGVAHDRVYVGSDDRKFYCFNETTGELLWSFQTGGKVSSSPCLTDDRVLFGSDDNKLYCLDAITGNHLWNFSTGGDVRSSPAVADGKVFFGSVDTKFYALNFFSGALVWNYATTGSITVSPSVLNGKVFTSSHKTIHCFDTLNGDPIWNYTTGGSIHSSPAIAYGNLYVGCNDFKMYCLSTEEGESKWNFTTSNIIYSSPAVADGKVFFGSDDRNVYCLNATTGTENWHYYTGGYARTCSPAVCNEVVIIASSYKLFAFGFLNTPPVAANLTIEPSIPLTTDNMVGSYDYSDEDGDPENGTEIRWFKDDVLQSAYNNALILPSYATAEGEIWYFTVRPKDGIDFGELRTSSPVTITGLERDVAVTNITLSKSVVGQNHSMYINVTVENQGDYHEVFNVTVSANTTTIQTKEATLANGTSTLITFMWNTTGFAKGEYNLSAYAELVPGETDTADNTLIDGWVIVAMVGDITGPCGCGWPDGKVDIRDIGLVASKFGAVYPDPRYNANCDLTGPTLGVADGKIDIRDIAMVSIHFGEVDP